MKLFVRVASIAQRIILLLKEMDCAREKEKVKCQSKGNERIQNG